MRSLFIIGFICCVLVCGQAQAASTEVDCGACRDVYEFPKDYGNHAYNQVFATNQVSLSDGSKMLVTNPTGHWAMVDLDFVVEATGFTFMIPIGSYNFSLPNGRINIFVQDPRGNSREYMVLSGSPALLVGDGSVQSAPSESEPEPETEPAITEAPDKAGGGTETFNWGQEGTYYWYMDQPEFNFITGSM